MISIEGAAIDHYDTISDENLDFANILRPVFAQPGIIITDKVQGLVIAADPAPPPRGKLPIEAPGNDQIAEAGDAFLPASASISAQV